jgi:hypothetical protein
VRALLNKVDFIYTDKLLDGAGLRLIFAATKKKRRAKNGYDEIIEASSHHHQSITKNIGMIASSSTTSHPERALFD